MLMLRPRRAGFTIVELLIVIVVIAILATIAVVAYNGVQQRARDTKRKDDLAKITKAFQLWAAETGGDFGTMSAGAAGAEYGWFDQPYAEYPSVASVLVGAGYLDESVVDPINRRSPADQASAYMITTCSSTSDTSRRIILARLETPPTETMADQLGESCTSASLTNYMTTYGVNYGRMITL